MKKQYTPYQQRIRQCFADAYGFFDTHKHPRTDYDWQQITDAATQYKDPLTIKLISAVIFEFERDYMNHAETTCLEKSST